MPEWEHHLESSGAVSCISIEMDPDPTQVYFWPTVNKRPRGVLLGLTQWDFFWPDVKKIEKFGIFRGNLG